VGAEMGLSGTCREKEKEERSETREPPEVTHRSSQQRKVLLPYTGRWG
jgi:hypothetical protein